MTAVVLYVQLHGLLVFGYRICRLPPIRDMGRSDTGCERRRLAENMGYPNPSEMFLTLCANGRLTPPSEARSLRPRLSIAALSLISPTVVFLPSPQVHTHRAIGVMLTRNGRRDRRYHQAACGTCGKREHRNVNLDPVPVPHNGREKAKGLLQLPNIERRRRPSPCRGLGVYRLCAGQTMLRVTSTRLPEGCSGNETPNWPKLCSERSTARRHRWRLRKLVMIEQSA